MTKNKKAFWKKLIGRNKSSISSLKSEPNLLLHYDSKKEPVAEKNKRSSGLFYYQIPPPTPKPAAAQQLVVKDNNTPLKKEEDNISTEQPNVTPASYSNSNKQNDESVSSFVVVEDKKEEEIAQLQSIIDSLKSELENEKATNQALQKQKQAIAKDLDYFEVTIDEILEEKNNLTQQLEEEKAKCQQHLDELNLLLQKMKTNADNTRELSLTKSELKSLQEKVSKDQETHLLELSEKEKTIRELKSQLNQSQEKVETLKETIDQLIKTHSEELQSRIIEAANNNNSKEEESPIVAVEPKETMVIRKKASNIPVPNSLRKPSSTLLKFEAPKEDAGSLDEQLLMLIKEKEKLQSSYSKLPLNGGGPKYRRRKEELESMLDQVDSQLSKVKQKIKRS